MDPDQGESMITPATQIIAPTAAYDHVPDLGRFGRIGRTRGVDIVLDAAHGPLIRVDEIHVAYRVTGLIISGQESKIVTPGDEYGFIVTTDPVVAAYIAMIRNVGRTPDPAPAWWPAGIGEALGGNERAGEISALLMGGSLDLYLDWEERRATEFRALRAGLAAHPELPWRMLPEQPGVEGLFYKAFLQWLPERSANANAWARVGYHRTMEWLARELLTEVATCYPTPDNPAAEYHPQVPWAPPALIPDIDPSAYLKARALVASAQLLPHELLARSGGGTQALGAMLKMARWIDDPQIADWAMHTGA
jgi:dTDP-4-amino-4,6-dideoxygalactose transaminase